ncbi:hydroxyethylthiazole kinase [Pasteurella atlantica]|uniref:Hydroxyethylthiazole kinase n=2 Tax=Pasteurellaceae TaxID=712 RepID=A0ACC6HL00_9PAST|nr:hydroxyethylthiazole kinase [Pasteurella atlantica]MDP8051473.1 hydroxyethylthiazole kinase [Pasteurella atlantica]MDP8104647.1 hydroxyethylthiazole kinase [Pasteurella atlantica]MDP8148131.1 hydroxyethylthiazole kinase [Pasteurella atlantica]
METQLISKIRQQNPLIHNITNIVVANFSANGLLVLGASPIMSDSLEEMHELPALSNALVINMGTLSEPQIQAMILAGKTANSVNVPVVFDPVGVGATSFRKNTAKRILDEVKCDLIRGNAGEIAYLAGVEWNAKGVDAGKGDADLSEIAKIAAQKYHCIVAISGEIDYISNGKQVAKIENGTPMLPKITGSGCLLSAVCGAFLSVVDKKDYFTAVINSCCAYAIAGEIAATSLNLTETGDFYVKFINSLGALNDEMVRKNARVSYEN